MEDTYDIEKTIVSGIRCKKCNSTLPDMLMKDHIQSAFVKECPHAFPAKAYETPVMMWVRINNQIREKRELLERMPTKAEETKWIRSCEKNRDKSREMYLALREEYDNSEPHSKGYKFCLSMKNVEADIIKKGDSFHRRVKAVFDGLY